MHHRKVQLLIRKMVGLQIHHMTVELKDQDIAMCLLVVGIVMYWLVGMLTHVLLMDKALHLAVVLTDVDYLNLLPEQPDQCTA